MNRWMRRIVAVLEIGSGFMGIVALLLVAPWTKDSSPGTLIVSLVALCLGFLGIVAGLLVAESRQLGLWLSLPYQMAQIPVIASVAVTYQFLPGLQIVAGRFGDLNAVLFQCQSNFTFSIGRPPDVSSCGLNLSALFLFLYLAWVLGRGYTRTTSSGPSAASAQTQLGIFGTP